MMPTIEEKQQWLRNTFNDELIEGGPGSGPHPTGKSPMGKKSPDEMAGSEINKELDKHDAFQSKHGDWMIANGMGHMTSQDVRNSGDERHGEYLKSQDRAGSLRNEISRRYGPGAPSRLPKGFGPIKKNY